MKRGAPPAVPGSLTAGEWAFVRAWAQGIGADEAAERYLKGHAEDGDAPGGRTARSVLGGLLQRLRTLARALGRPDLAGLLGRDPTAMRDRGTERPTLESFREQFPPDFYSESELVELYQTEHGATDARSAARRRERLRARQLDALQWLEGQTPRGPQAGDALAAWLAPALATRLAAGGLGSVADLARACRKEPGWHQRVRGLGPVGAARLHDWLHTTAPDLLPPRPQPQPRRPATADRPMGPPAPGTGILPLERFRPPPDLDGRQGLRRAPQAACRIEARTDLAALQCWLERHGEGSHTWRAYRREAERLLLWAVLERGKPLSSLQPEDCRAYLDFMASPGPAWLGGRHTRRSHPDWRPWEAALSPSSVATARRVLRVLFADLVRWRYLDGNAWDELATDGADGAERADDRDQSPAAPEPSPSPDWAHLSRWLARQAGDAAGRRLRLLLWLGYGAGLRPSELQAACVADLRPPDSADAARGHPGASMPGWTLQVRGTGDHARRVPLPDEALQAMADHLADRGLGRRPERWPGDQPLVTRLRDAQPLSAMRIYELVRQAGEACARAIAAQAPAAAQGLQGLSSRRLRAAQARRLLAGGLPLPWVQAAMGHRRAGSTAAYADAADLATAANADRARQLLAGGVPAA